MQFRRNVTIVNVNHCIHSLYSCAFLALCDSYDSQSNSAGRCEFCVADHEFPMMSSFRLGHFELLLETSAMLRESYPG